jgi:hypothetical protein
MIRYNSDLPNGKYAFFSGRSQYLFWGKKLQPVRSFSSGHFFPFLF